MKMAALAVALLMPAIVAAAPRRIIIDTDAGTDDIMAIAFLLSRADVEIEAITVVNGLAHVQAGAANILRLLELAGKTGVPVYVGRDGPLAGSNAFPDAWRMTSDSLPSVTLPTTERKPQSEAAAAYLARRLKDSSRPVSILALGPLTNIADALATLPRGAYPVEDMVIMGGAVRVAGNLGLTGNESAEWNIFIDPAAARAVFHSALRFRLVPLDACNKVPVDAAFVREFSRRAKSALGRAVTELLESNATLIASHLFYAWDPLAAVALVNPAVLKISSLPVEIGDEGRTVESAGTRNMVRVALDSEPASFRKIFMDAFAGPAKK